MKSKLLIAFLVFIFLNRLILIGRPVTNNDEGIYLLTFYLVGKGYALYKDIFFSQLPGFFLSIHPLYLLLGKTIQAARLAVLFWSFLSFIALFWLGRMLKSLFIGPLAVLILLIIPTYFNQIVTFQSDGLAVVFSTIAIVFLIKYSKEVKNIWLIPFGLFFSLAVLTKADISLLIPTIFIFIGLIKNKVFSIEKAIKNLLFLFAILGLFSIVILLPFGLFDSLGLVAILRKQAYLVYANNYLLVFKYLLGDKALTFLFLSSLVVYIIKKPKLFSPETFFLVWLIYSFFSLFLYRPLFEHHLVFLVVPSALTFSITLGTFLKNKLFQKVFNVLIIILFLFVGLNSLRSVSMYQYIDTPSFQGNYTEDQRLAIDLVEKYSGENDVIISDEALILVATNRMTPPELADMSLVRFKTGSISAESFRLIIEKYKPKLILAWNGRLNTLQGLEKVLKDYTIISYSENKKVFIFKE